MPVMRETEVAEILGRDPAIRDFLESMGAVYCRRSGTIEYVDPGSDSGSLMGLDYISRTYPKLSACMRALDGEAQFFRDEPLPPLSEAEIRDRVRIRDLVPQAAADKGCTDMKPKPVDYQI